MGSFIDMAGRRCGRWTVLARASGDYKGAFWHTICECGGASIVEGYALRFGLSLSCGCYTLEVNSARRTHGQSDSSEYQSWCASKQRCINPNHIEYPRYGARGVTMCDRWLNDFSAFLADMGKKPTPEHSIDRIDGNKGYSPDNCRWADLETQNNNKRTNLIVEYRGERVTIFHAVKMAGAVVTPRQAGHRLRKGWGVAKAIETPVRKMSRRAELLA